MIKSPEKQQSQKQQVKDGFKIVIENVDATIQSKNFDETIGENDKESSSEELSQKS